MTQFLKLSFLLFSTIVLTLGCSGGGRNLGGGGQYCNLNSFNSLKGVPETAQEIAVFKPSENKGSLEEVFTGENFPLGTYEMQSAQFLYVHKVDPSNQRRWIMTQISETVDSVKTEIRNDGKTYYKNSRSCAGGYRVSDPSYQASISGIRDFTVGEDKKVLLDQTTIWGYQWDSKTNMIQEIFQETDPDTGQSKNTWAKPEESGKYQSPKDLYDGDNVFEMSLHKLPTAGWEGYQVFTQVDLGDNIFLLLKIIYKRTPLAEPTDSAEDDDSKLGVDPL